ncbi:MAG: methyltransferase domain-containing protein [Candidatus Portnoybacteria bacterium]|nr:methyltransferase domain-containing protein [Candidatus Portnoybacteria bacterium]MDD4982480.1 methyltransferase domain-containing protein [Candidatus Portnoybacteria bacterium]
MKKINDKNITQTKEAVQYFTRFIVGRTLDLGAGSAKYRDIIKDKATEYIALDMFPGEHIDVVGDVLALPFEDGSFDTVISTQVLEHVEKPWVMIEEIFRVLKSGGICVLSCPFLAPYHPDPKDYFRYTKDGLISLFRNAGFEILECESYGKFFTTLKELVRLSFFSRFKAYKEKKQGPWANRFLRWSQKLAAWLDGRIKGEPAVYANVYIAVKKRDQ